MRFASHFFLVISVLVIGHSHGIAPAETMEDEYDAASTGILEALYGKNFLSHGGVDYVDKMFKGIPLRHKKILDIGCGFGGPSAYLAKKHAATITGIDLLKHVIERAQQNAIQQKLDNKLTFLCTPQLPYPLADESFDVAFSKEALLHARDKPAVIREIYRLLKPGGQVVILDWVFSQDTNDAVKALFNLPTFHPITPQNYVDFFNQAGFTDISTSEQNAVSCKHTTKSIKLLKKKQDLIVQQFGTERYQDALLAWNTQYTLFNDRQVLVIMLKARKPAAKATTAQPVNAFRWYDPRTWFGKAHQ